MRSLFLIRDSDLGPDLESPSSGVLESPSRTESLTKWLRATQRLTRVGMSAMTSAGRLRQLRKDPRRKGVLASRLNILHELSYEVLETHALEVSVQGRFLPGPALYVSNHVSYLDPLVVMSRAPMMPVAKGEVRSWPVIGDVAAASGVCFVRRGDAHNGATVLRRMMRAWKAGMSVLNFPEGTTTASSALIPFHRGAFGAAQLMGVPVVPLAIVYALSRMQWVGDALFLPHYLSLAAQERCRVRLLVGAPLAPKMYRGVDALTQAARRAIQDLLSEVNREAAVCA